VDPEALPAGGAQARVDVLGVVAALAGDDGRAAPQRLEAVGVLQLRLVLRELRRRPALVAGAEEDRLDQREVACGLHPVEQHGADHAAPADQSCEFHLRCPVWKWEILRSARPSWPGEWGTTNRSGLALGGDRLF